MSLRILHNTSKKSAWSLDSPDELAWLERLDPEFRGIGDNPVFRYLRYADRRKRGAKKFAARAYDSYPFSFGLGVLILLLTPTLTSLGISRQVLLQMGTNIISIGLIQLVVPRLVDQGYRRNMGFAAQLQEIRRRAECLEFGIVEPNDIAIGVWAYLSFNHVRLGKRLGGILVALGAVAALLLPNLLGAFLGMAFGGLGLFAIASRRAPQIPALASAESILRGAMIAEREALSGLGVPDRLWRYADHAMERFNRPEFGGPGVPPLIFPPAVYGAGLVLMAGLVALLLWTLFGYAPPAHRAAAVILNLTLSGAFAWIGWVLGRGASSASPRERARYLHWIREDAKVLVELWGERFRRFGAEVIDGDPPGSQLQPNENPNRLRKSIAARQANRADK